MAENTQIPTDGKLLWSGEHWIAYLRPDGTQRPGAMVSLYHAYISPAGRGTAAFVQIDGENGFTGLCTDSHGFARFVKETQITPAVPYDPEMSVVDAEFRKGGDVLERPCWTISTDSREVVTTWDDLQTPLVAPPTANPRIVFTILVFAGKANIDLDGKSMDGDPYPRSIWAKSLGTPMSSCVFALAETMVRE